MFRLFLFCLMYGLFTLPVGVRADDSESVQVPEPPQLPKKLQSAETQPEPVKEDDQPSVPPVAAPEPPDLPMPVKSGENLEPDITIVRRGTKTVQEYRRNGILYMVKVIPDKGPAYYLIDTNGDGKLDVRGSDLDKGLNINQWKLLEWN